MTITNSMSELMNWRNPKSTTFHPNQTLDSSKVSRDKFY